MAELAFLQVRKSLERSMKKFAVFRCRLNCLRFGDFVPHDGALAAIDAGGVLYENAWARSSNKDQECALWALLQGGVGE
jgi:hypothetical protein